MSQGLRPGPATPAGSGKRRVVVLLLAVGLLALPFGWPLRGLARIARALSPQVAAEAEWLEWSSGHPLVLGPTRGLSWEEAPRAAFDPWGQTFVSAKDGVHSAGPDGEFGGPDDVFVSADTARWSALSWLVALVPCGLVAPCSFLLALFVALEGSWRGARWIELPRVAALAAIPILIWGPYILVTSHLVANELPAAREASLLPLPLAACATCCLFAACVGLSLRVWTRADDELATAATASPTS